MQQPMVELLVVVNGTTYSPYVDKSTTLEEVKQCIFEQTGHNIISFLKANGATVCPPAPTFASLARAHTISACALTV